MLEQLCTFMSSRNRPKHIITDNNRVLELSTAFPSSHFMECLNISWNASIFHGMRVMSSIYTNMILCVDNGLCYKWLRVTTFYLVLTNNHENIQSLCFHDDYSASSCHPQDVNSKNQQVKWVLLLTNFHRMFHIWKKYRNSTCGWCARKCHASFPILNTLHILVALILIRAVPDVPLWPFVKTGEEILTSFLTKRPLLSCNIRMSIETLNAQ